ncbi:glycosyltransferase family 4 protein [Patescibacteria group bacterium]|nr:glycosyltransferase family 4 protein [Patescibacteria group bacterium]MBU4580722.1 glycosyltransferase family 4 protein [Patescibacteria group bacterium]
MRIGIDARTILNPELGEAIGIGHYTFMLIRHLLKMDADFKSGKNEYVLFFDNRVRKKDVERFKIKGVRIVNFPFSSYRRYLPGVYSEILVNAMFSREKLDILHSPGGSIPLSYRGKTAVTESGIGIRKFSDMFPPYQRLSASFAKSILAKTNHIIVNSEAAKKDTIDCFGIGAEKITVVYKGVDQRFFDKVGQKEIARVKEKYKIKGKYFLFLSTIKPINNLVGLVRSFAGARGKFLKDARDTHFVSENDYSDCQLVLAGKEGWLSAEEVAETAKELQIEKEIILTGYVPPEDLNGLFQGADLFLFPPFYEEFGAPALEAMASGIPVIASKISSLQEILGGGAVFVDPNNVEAWTREITSLVNNKSRQSELVRQSAAQAIKYTWEKTAEETLAVYRRAYQS